MLGAQLAGVAHFRAGAAGLRAARARQAPHEQGILGPRHQIRTEKSYCKVSNYSLKLNVTFIYRIKIEYTVAGFIFLGLI